MSKKWCEDEQGRAPGRPPQGHREHRQLQGQRHRPVPAQGAPALGAHRAGQELQLVGQGREQRRRGRVHADRQRRHPRRGAAFRRDRRDGAGAAAGRRAHQVGRASTCCRAPSCARSSSAWTRSATSCSSATSRARTRSRTCACATPSTRRSTRRRSRRASCAARRCRPALMVGAAVRGFQADMNKRPAVRPRSGEEAAGRCRLPERLRGRHELPQRPLRQRRRDLPGGGGEPRAHRRQGQPHGRDEGQLLPEDPAPRHQLLPARLDAEHRRLARRAVVDHGDAERQGPGPVQPRRLQQPEDRRADR